MRIDVLNGVNLDVLGKRDAGLYGGLSLSELETRIYEWASELGVTVRCRQTNHEGEFVEWCHDLFERVDGAVVNAASWTHYSWAIRDALALVGIPIVEVHLSNVDEDEDWRRTSVLADIAAARIVGRGVEGYRDALAFLAGRQE